MANLGLNFLKNLIVSLAMACLVQIAGVTTMTSGLVVGFIVACGFSATAIADVFIWENRTYKNILLGA